MGVVRAPAHEPLGLPFDRLHPDGTRYVSFADWLCPTHCIEPARCPAIAAPRTWEMSESVERWAARRALDRPSAPPAIFACRHVSHGVGMYPAGPAMMALDALAGVVERSGEGEMVVASVSACHGAVGLLRIGGPVGAAL